MREPFEKQTKTTEDQGKHLITAIKEHQKQIIESNEVAKNDFNIDRRVVSNEKQKEIFNRLVKERVNEFADTKDKIDLNELVYKSITGVNEPKGFKNYQMPWKLFEDLRDGDINPKDVSKNQARFKLHLIEIKTGGKKSLHQKGIIKILPPFMVYEEK